MRADQALHPAPDLILFHVDVAAAAQLPQGGGGEGMRDHRHAEAGATYIPGRQADAIDGDRAFLDHLDAAVLRQGKGQALTVTFAAPRYQAAHAIDMAADQMAAEAPTQGQGPLQVDLLTGTPLAHGGFTQGFTADIKAGNRAIQGHHGQAGAVDGDRITNLAILGKGAQVYRNLLAAAEWAQGGDRSKGFNDAGEHGGQSRRHPGNSTVELGLAIASYAGMSPTAREDLVALVDDFGDDGLWLVTELEQLAAAEPDPEQVWRDVVAFVGRGSRLATELRGLHSDPLVLSLLVRLSTHSRFGAELVQHIPRMFWDAVQEREFRQVWGRQTMAEGLQRQLGRLDALEHRINALVRFRNYNLLRIMIGDIAGTMSFEAITSELSDMTDVLVQAALDLAADKLRSRFGSPACGMSVIGMGKLGGRELNYSSDIDLIFVYHGRGETSGGRKQIDHHEYFCRLGSEMIRILDDHHPSGRLFRVDMRLRPEGASGELALSLQETVDYYYTVGRAWERQAMIKARPIAGDLALGDALLTQLRSWVYPADQRLEDLDAARMMRRRIEERASDDNVKAGAGGIRDIEFLVQYYQLTYGGRVPALRLRATLPAIRVLQDQGLLSRDDAATLEDDYIWLRMVEHRLQMHEGRQLHDLPEDRAERLHLAARCGFLSDEGGAAFDRHHEQVRSRVRRLSEQHYLGVDEQEDAAVVLLTSEHLPEAVAQRLLAPLGFTDPVKAAERLRTMATEPFFILQQSRTERTLIKLLPHLLERLAAGA